MISFLKLNFAYTLFQNGWVMWYPMEVCLQAESEKVLSLAECDEHSLQQKWHFKRYSEKYKDIVESIQLSQSKEHYMNQTVFSRVFGVAKTQSDNLYWQKLADVISRSLKSTN